jgi:ATP-binding cassette, subfamily B, bacterial
VVLLALILGTGCMLLVPSKIGELVAALSEMSGEQPSSEQLFRPAAEIAGLLILQALLAAVSSYVISHTSEHVINGLRVDFFRNLISRPLDEAGPKQLGQIASEFASDLVVIQGGLSETLINFLRHALFSVGAVAALFLVDFRMTALSLAGVGVIALVIVGFIKLATKAVVSVQKYRARTVALLLESASNAYVIQAYGRIDYMNSRFVERLDQTFARVKRQLRLVALMNPVTLVVFAVIIYATLAYGLAAVRDGRLSVAELVSYLTWAVILVVSVSMFGQLAGRLHQSGILFEKHSALLSPTAADPATRRDLLFGPADPAVSAEGKPAVGYALEKVSFSYPDAELPALFDVSFEIPAGQVTAIIGESGAGKSTAAGLLCGVYFPTSGSLRFIDGAGATVPPPSRHDLAVVPQEPFLFAGTVFDNIGFGREGVSPSDVEWAARQAQIHDHIRDLPGGYRAGVEEGGRNFSRGQQQRLALARALVARPRLLVLDEATASVDVVTERAIKTTIQALRGQATIVIIAHQGELLADVDHLVVLDRGRLVQAGPPSRSGVSHDVVTHLTRLRRAREDRCAEEVQ